MLRNSGRIGRIFAIAALAVAVAVVAVVVLSGPGSEYRIKARFENASQLVRGNDVQVAGVPIGSVEDIELTRDGGADVELVIQDDEYTPLREGTEAVIRLTSLSGVANRYVDLMMPSGDPPEIPEGGSLPTTQTTSAVDLDQLLNTLDEKTRNDLQGVIQGFGKQIDGRSEAANRGWLYLNPNLAATSRLFEELSYDKRAFEDFVLASSKLVTDVGAKRDDLAGLVDNLATFTTAVGNKRAELADAISQLPPFMRRANSTFVNLRAALDDLRPLVEESKPVARRLRPFFAELRPLARDARPTFRDLSALIRRAGADNDLVELTRGQVPLRDVAMRDVQVNGKKRRGAFPESTEALSRSIQPLGFARPYAVDLTGWFDDFGHSGTYDALGGRSRVGTYINAFAQINGVLRPIPVPLRDDAAAPVTARDQRNRCAGAAEFPAPDGSNPYKPSQDYNCDPGQVLPGR